MPGALLTGGFGAIGGSGGVPEVFVGLNNVELLTNPNGNGLFEFSLDGDTGTSAHRLNFAVPFEQIRPFNEACLAGRETVTENGTTTIRRKLPALSPLAHIFPGTYARRITGRAPACADDDVTELRPWPWVVATVHFETLPYPTGGNGAWLTLSYQGSANYATVPGARLRFSGGEWIDHDVGKLIGQVALRLTSHQIPDLAAYLDSVEALAGKANSLPFTIAGRTFPAGSLLFPTFDAETTLDTGGIATHKASFTLLRRAIPWNSGITSTGAVQAITPPPYETANYAAFLG